MIKSLWFLTKIIILVALALWVAQQPGHVVMQWGGYTLTVQMGAFLAFSIIALAAALMVYRVIRAIAGIPRAWRRFREKQAREKGYRALTAGLTAVAAGDAEKARAQVRRLRKYWPHENGLPELLEAQTARLEGHEDEAKKHFTTLLEHKDAAFLGVRGLLQAALDSGDNGAALHMGRRALKLYPKQGWILQLVYDLEVRAQNWALAENVLTKAERTGAFSSEKAKSDRIAMLLLRADEASTAGNVTAALRFVKQALSLDESFTPTVERAAAIFSSRNEIKKTVKAIEKAWKKAPHPELVPLWMGAMPERKGGDPMARLKWGERLLKFNPESIESHLAAAQICIEMALWGEARKHLEAAEKRGADARVYDLRAQLEEKAGRPFEEVQAWRAKAAEAPPAPAWVCTVSGRIYPRWQPVAQPHGSFNSIIWGDPQGASISVLSYRHPFAGLGDARGFLDAPYKRA